ncbi:Sister-chromatid cohesion protein 3 [Porphyridium purpureum]|uniref:Sister-chromatid cohesion protein 3 n=1 Tax=Porphyridium purpureum TaxID=35688 RepID=A0A5J4YP74_PORPP|nr:Sister-chromatid cohesion protein 3 [Porphyridium purpureum]|eukprot:POR8256..scf222_8
MGADVHMEAEAAAPPRRSARAAALRSSGEGTDAGVKQASGRESDAPVADIAARAHAPGRAKPPVGPGAKRKKNAAALHEAAGGGKSQKHKVPGPATLLGRLKVENSDVEVKACVAEWLQRLVSSGAAAVAELVELVFRAAVSEAGAVRTSARNGPNAALVNSASILSDNPDEYVYKMCDVLALDDVGKGIMLQAKDRDAKKFQAAFALWWATIPLDCPEDVLFESDAVDTVLTWFQRMSVASSRPLRYVATLASYHMMTGFIGVRKRLDSQLAALEQHSRSAGANPKRHPQAHGHTRSEAADTSTSALDATRDLIMSRIDSLNELMESVFSGVFVLRYRDAVPEIRALSIKAMGSWVIAYPTMYLTDSCLKYCGWLLSDKAATIRQAALGVLSDFLDPTKSLRTILGTFLERFWPRIKEMCRDIDGEASRRAFNVCRLASAAFPTLLDRAEKRELCMLFFLADHAPTRSAAAELFLAGSEVSSSATVLIEEVGAMIGECGKAPDQIARAAEVAVNAFAAYSDALFDWRAYRELLLDGHRSRGGAHKKDKTHTEAEQVSVSAPASAVALSQDAASSSRRRSTRTSFGSFGGSTSASQSQSHSTAAASASASAATAEGKKKEEELVTLALLGAACGYIRGRADLASSGENEDALAFMSRYLGEMVVPLLEHFQSETQGILLVLRLLNFIQLDQLEKSKKRSRADQKQSQLCRFLVEHVNKLGAHKPLIIACVGSLNLLAQTHEAPVLSRECQSALTTLAEEASRSLHALCDNLGKDAAAALAIDGRRHVGAQEQEEYVSVTVTRSILFRTEAIIAYEAYLPGLESSFDDALEILRLLTTTATTHGTASPAMSTARNVASIAKETDALQSIVRICYWLFLWSMNALHGLLCGESASSSSRTRGEEALAALVDQKRKLLDGYHGVLIQQSERKPDRADALSHSGQNEEAYFDLCTATIQCALNVLIVAFAFVRLPTIDQALLEGNFDRTDVRELGSVAKNHPFLPSMVSQFVHWMLSDTVDEHEGELDDEAEEEEQSMGDKVVSRDVVRASLVGLLVRAGSSGVLPMSFMYAPLMFVSKNYFGEQISDIAKSFHNDLRARAMETDGNEDSESNLASLQVAALYSMHVHGDEEGALLRNLALSFVARSVTFRKSSSANHELEQLATALSKFCLADADGIALSASSGEGSSHGRRLDGNRMAELRRRLRMLEVAGCAIVNRLSEQAAEHLWQGIQALLPDAVLEKVDKDAVLRPLRAFRNALARGTAAVAILGRRKRRVDNEFDQDEDAFPPSIPPTPAKRRSARKVTSGRPKSQNVGSDLDSSASEGHEELTGERRGRVALKRHRNSAPGVSGGARPLSPRVLTSIPTDSVSRSELSLNLESPGFLDEEEDSTAQILQREHSSELALSFSSELMQSIEQTPMAASLSGKQDERGDERDEEKENQLSASLISRKRRRW